MNISIITCGAHNSPHVRAISIAARQLGFGDVHLFLRGPPPADNLGGDGNLFLNCILSKRGIRGRREGIEEREERESFDVI